MPKLNINGQSREIKNLSIPAVLENEAVPFDDWGAIAVARNGSIIPKSAWESTALNENDRIEIVRAFAGG
ncbi:MAG TPA: sulfur carrier protein ThiS [Alphaproteobacteria bacterium]|nr:sulfur carrier protein ThiS [Alphaproteobacteria bacterium]